MNTRGGTSQTKLKSAVKVTQHIKFFKDKVIASYLSQKVCVSSAIIGVSDKFLILKTSNVFAKVVTSIKKRIYAAIHSLSILLHTTEVTRSIEIPPNQDFLTNCSLKVLMFPIVINQPTTLNIDIMDPRM